MAACHVVEVLRLVANACEKPEAGWLLPPDGKAIRLERQETCDAEGAAD